MTTIYVLKLKGEKYYVGKTTNPKNRIEQHKIGNGSEWTKLYEPENIADTMMQTLEFTELAVTLQYMKKYGIDNVRGASYSTVNLSHLQKTEIERHIRGEYDLCFFCGNNSHFAASCPDKPLTCYERVCKWFCCLRKKIPTLDYTLVRDDTDIIHFGKYKGRSYRDVWKNDKRYCNWVKNTNSSFSEFNKFKSWLVNQANQSF